MAEITPQTDLVPAFRWKKPVILAALALFGFYASTHMVAADDTWVALACGRHFANHGVDTVEPFSFNSHPAGPSDEQLAAFPEWTHGMIRFWHPTGWINQNWLTHLTFYKLATWFGSDGDYNYETLVYWKYALFITTIFVVFALGKTLGAGDFLSLVAACCAMVIGRSFYDIRPACYSNLLVPLFILLLALSTYKHYKYIWLMIPLIVFWANVHGGYIYAYLMLTPFMAVHILLNLPRRWSLSLGLSGLWMVLYLLSYKFHTNMYYLEVMQVVQPDYEATSFVSGLLVTGVVLAAISLILAAWRNAPSGLFYSFHVVVSLVYPIVLLASNQLQFPAGLNPQFMRILNHFMFSHIAGFLLLLVLGVLVVVLLAMTKERFVRIPNRTIGHIFAAAGVSFLAMILFNPFRLTNLTHTFEISISEHAASWRAVKEWRPAFDWMDPTTDLPNPVGDQGAFAVMVIVGLVILSIWATFHLLRPATRPVRKGPRHQATSIVPPEIGWPKIDMALTLVGLLTIYMAFESRRFIALAGPSASPVLALFVFQIGQMFTARRNWQTTQRLEPSLPPLMWQKYAWAVVAGFLVVFGGWVGLKYHRIYRAPWPVDGRRDSVFMRMTASQQKPFEVCDFINANQLTGRIFNYWTEGGGLVFGQNPDPETGKTPLQHFMDGRAQAAFDHDTFKLWQHIFSGGSLAMQIAQEGRNPTTDELRQIGAWLDEEFKARQVWIVLMPRIQMVINSTFLQAITTTPNWKTVYLDDMQHLLVDDESEQGRQLVADVLEGRALFPDEFSRQMTLARLTLETDDPRHSGKLLDYAEAVVRLRPGQESMIVLIQASYVPMYRDKANLAMREYLESFAVGREAFKRKSGYLQHLSSAIVAARHLASLNPPDEAELIRLAESLIQESLDISKRHAW